MQTVHSILTSISVQNRTAFNAGPYPRFLCKFNAVRTAINAGRTDSKLLDFCAGKLMQTVQHLMGRTIPRFLCKQNAAVQH